MKRPRKSREERRLEVIEATLHLAARIGPDRITAESIAQELGLSQPAIFRHFPKKNDIWEATIEWVRQSLTRQWSDAVRDAPPGKHLQLLAQAHFAFIEAHPALPLVLLSPEIQARHESVRKAVTDLMALFHEELRQAVLSGQQSGCLRDRLPPGQIAWMVLAVIQGIALRWAASKAAFSIGQEGMALLNLALEGVKPDQNQAGPILLTPASPDATS